MAWQIIRPRTWEFVGFGRKSHRACRRRCRSLHARHPGRRPGRETSAARHRQTRGRQKEPAARSLVASCVGCSEGIECKQFSGRVPWHQRLTRDVGHVHQRASQHARQTAPSLAGQRREKGWSQSAASRALPRAVVACDAVVQQQQPAGPAPATRRTRDPEGWDAAQAARATQAARTLTSSLALAGSSPLPWGPGGCVVRCGAQARGLTESRRPLPWPSSWENQGLGMQVASQ